MPVTARQCEPSRPSDFPRSTSHVAGRANVYLRQKPTLDEPSGNDGFVPKAAVRSARDSYGR